MSKEKLKPCPFCGGEISITIRDSEGNHHDKEYEKDPWSGLSYSINHPESINKGCPIANHDEESVGIFLYDTREGLIKAWNRRTK